MLSSKFCFRSTEGFTIPWGDREKHFRPSVSHVVGNQPVEQALRTKVEQLIDDGLAVVLWSSGLGDEVLPPPATIQPFDTAQPDR